MTDDFWLRVREAFDAVADAPTAQRAELLRAASGGDAAVERETLALLSIDPGAFLEGHAVFPVDADLLRAQLTDGAVVGGYQVTRLLGRGGMGEVYEGVRDSADFHKRVAIKVLRPGSISADAVRRFEQERRILAGLDHRNIATLIDGGMLPDGRPFLVMELVEGVRITDWCTQQGLSVDARLVLFRQICGAVSHAHRNLVVHRDIKPGNILVTPDGTVKLLDFGIAKVLDADTSGGSDSTATRAGAAGLTPEYASPEQLTGGVVTTATDVYALGLLLFEMLTGARPFATGTQPLPELTRLVLTTDPPMASRAVRGTTPGRDVEAIRRALRGDLDAIMLKALRTDPGERYPSVDALVAELQRHERGLPVEAMRGHRGYRLGKFLRRHHRALLAATAVAIAAVSGVVSTIRQSRHTQVERARAEATNAFLVEMLSSVDPAAAGKEVAMVEVLDSAAAHIGRDSALDPGVEASLRSAIGFSYRALGKFAAATPHLQRVVALRQRSPGNPLPIAIAYRELGQLHDGAGEYQTADSLYQLAIGVLPVRGDTGVATAATDLMMQRARLQSLQGEMAAADSILTLVAARQEARYGAGSLESAKALTQLGVTVAQEQHFPRAEAVTRRALAIFTKQLPPTHPDIGKTLGRLATILEQSGNRPAADRAYRESLASLDASLGADHPDVAWIRVNYAGFLLDGSDWDGAIREADALLRQRGGTLPDTHFGIGAALQLRALAYAGRGDDREAIAGLRESLAVRRTVMSPDHWTIGSSESLLGEELVHVGARAEGMQLLRAGCQRIARALGRENPSTRKAMTRLSAAGGSGC
ncbi:MAG: protein kinase [Gemmatimonadetes bacterium]|nr:protein kinase [Gemmatimonadota bacterium]